MNWTCPSCGTGWPAKPLVDGTIGCPECGSIAEDVLIRETLNDCGDRYGLEALDRMLSRLSAAEQERDDAREDAAREHELVEYWAGRAQAAEARAEAAEQALAAYADPKHWAIRRTGYDGSRLAYPDCVWIGPGAAQRVPDAVGIARAALAGREEPTPRGEQG